MTLISSQVHSQIGINEFRKSFFSSFFENNLEENNVVGETRTVNISYNEKNHRDEKQVSSSYRNDKRNVKFKIKIIEEELSDYTFVESDYYQFIRNNYRYNLIADSIDSKLIETNDYDYLDSVISLDMENVLDTTTNFLRFEYTIYKDKKKMFLSSDLITVRVKARIGFFDWFFLKNNNYELKDEKMLALKYILNTMSYDSDNFSFRLIKLDK